MGGTPPIFFLGSSAGQILITNEETKIEKKKKKRDQEKTNHSKFYNEYIKKTFHVYKCANAGVDELKRREFNTRPCIWTGTKKLNASYDKTSNYNKQQKIQATLPSAPAQLFDGLTLLPSKNQDTASQHLTNPNRCKKAQCAPHRGNFRAKDSPHSFSRALRGSSGL